MTITRGFRGFVAASSLGLGCNATAVADWLQFARGGRAELPASVRGSTVVVDAPGGSISFPRQAFRAIVPGGRLDDEWARRRAAAESAPTAAGRFAAGWWALEHGLAPEALAQFRSAASAEGVAGHAPLARVGRMLDRLDRPGGDPDLGPIRRSLGGSGWSERSGRHVTLIHQADEADARERLDVLDRVVETFTLALAAQGVDLTVPDRRLVSVWFARQADYVQFLRRSEAAPFADTQGYYHPTLGVVFAFDTRSAPDQAQARARIAVRRRDGSIPAEVAADLDRQSLLLDLRWRDGDLGIAAHETVHQLVAATGLAPRLDDFPIWLHEGLAAQFEVVRGGRWAGFGRANDHRLPDWRSIRPAPQLAPLLDDAGLDHGYQRDRYAEAWALVYFLRKTRPAEFATFLDLLRAPRPASSPPAPPVVAFRSAFGPDLGATQAEWRRFMQAQAHPAEVNSPADRVAAISD